MNGEQLKMMNEIHKIDMQYIKMCFFSIIILLKYGQGDVGKFC